MISIVTPVLNGAKFIENNIRSIQALDIPHEHLIVDGGSNDGTIEIIKKFKNVILLHQKEANGMYGAIHQGFMCSKGRYITWVNADDQIVREGFNKMYYRIQASDKIELVYSDGEFLFLPEERRKLIKAKKFAKYFLKQGFMPFVQPSSIYSKKLYEEVGGLRYNKFKIAGDLDMFQRMAFSSKGLFVYEPVKSTIFLKYGNSLGDRNSHIHKKEIQKLNSYNANSLLKKILFKLL